MIYSRWSRFAEFSKLPVDEYLFCKNEGRRINDTEEHWPRIHFKHSNYFNSLIEYANISSSLLSKMSLKLRVAVNLYKPRGTNLHKEYTIRKNCNEKIIG